MRGRADLRQAITADRAHLFVDFTQLTFIDTAGVAALEANQILEADGRHMLITNVPLASRRVFEILGATDLLRYDRTIATGSRIGM